MFDRLVRSYLHLLAFAGLLFALPLQAAPIAPDRLRADLRFVADIIERWHPEPAHSVDRRRFARQMRVLERAIDRPMSQDEAWALFARLNPIFADGHLLIGFPDWRAESREQLAQGAGFFPFEIVVDVEGNVRIAAELGGAASPHAGRRVETINGVPARRVARALLDRVHGDTPAFRAALLSQRWWFFHRKLFGQPRAFDIVLAGGARLTLPASRTMPASLTAEEDFDAQYRLELLPNRRALLTVGAFEWPDRPRYFAFMRDSFAAMREAGVQSLIIDVRANGGGSDDMWRDGILRYIADRPFRSGSRYIKRVLEAYRDEDEVTGELVRGEIETFVQPRDEPLRFTGSVHVLVGPRTYSSAVLFANVAQDFRFATLVGVGGAVRARQSGSVQTATLPNSGLVLSYPRFILDRPSGRREPPFVEPDIAIADDPLRPRAAVETLLTRLDRGQE